MDQGLGRLFVPVGRALLLLALLSAGGCIHRGLHPLPPERPLIGPAGAPLRAPPQAFLFPERSLLDSGRESPPQALARVDEIFAQIGSITQPEPVWKQALVGVEIDSIRASLDRLHIGPQALFLLHLRRTPESERARFHKAAALYLRWGLALMRMGEINQRVWGAEKLRQAVAWDPENALSTLVLAGYYELGGYWSQEQDLLSSFTRAHGRHDVIELKRLHTCERAWTVTREREELDRAQGLAREIVKDHQDAGSAPAWLDLECARLSYLADSTSSARAWAARAAERAEEAPRDTPVAAQAELLLGLLDVRDLEYDQAKAHLERGQLLAATQPALAGLASWMAVPWDLWTERDQRAFLGASDRMTKVEQFWREHDFIMATPDLSEGRLEYLRRVGECWFTLSGVDPARPGPLSDPGRVILRFGWPAEWTSRAGEEAAFCGPDPILARKNPPADFGIQRSWRFLYHFPGVAGDQPTVVLLQDHGSSSRFSAVDSLRGPGWPPVIFTQDYGGKGYRLNTSISRFREPGGKIRLILSYDTYLPEYSVRYPLQGLHYQGEARVRSAVYRAQGRRWQAGPRGEFILGHETEIEREWTFRRRSGIAEFPGLEAGTIRVASELRLRDTTGTTIAIAVDNGPAGKLDGFSDINLDASDLLLLSSLDGVSLLDEERQTGPGWLVSGPRLTIKTVHPRADRNLFAGETLPFYLEVYNIDTRAGVTEAELLTSLERLRTDGTTEYSVSIRGQGQTLTKRGVTQWNIIRSIGLANLGPGRYRLRAVVHDHQAGRRVERSVEFRVIDPTDLIRLYRWDQLEAPGRG
jgi:hypothetical protein